MTLEEALEKSGTANLVDDKTLQATKELIEPDEEILYALYTKYAFMSIFETVTTNLMLNQDGIVIVTNNRMICFKKQKRAIDDIIEMRIIEIKNIGQMGNLMADVGYLYILSDIYRWRIYASNKEQLDGIKSAIYMAKDLHEQSKKTIETTADEIIKFKKLADEGIITEEEFQKKKEQLLNI